MVRNQSNTTIACDMAIRWFPHVRNWSTETVTRLIRVANGMNRVKCLRCNDLDKSNATLTEEFYGINLGTHHVMEETR